MAKILNLVASSSFLWPTQLMETIIYLKSKEQTENEQLFKSFGELMRTLNRRFLVENKSKTRLPSLKNSDSHFKEQQLMGFLVVCVFVSILV